MTADWFTPDEIEYAFYQAEHPWGPWKFINFCDDKFLGGNNHVYVPDICAKFQKRIGNAVEVWLFNSGCHFKNDPGLYKFWVFPLILRTAPAPSSIGDNDANSSAK